MQLKITSEVIKWAQDNLSLRDQCALYAAAGHRSMLASNPRHYGARAGKRYNRYIRETFKIPAKMPIFEDAERRVD